MKKQKVIFEDSRNSNIKRNLSKEEDGIQKVDQAHTDMHATSSEAGREIKVQSEKFEKLIKKSERVLLRIKAVFPFEFFPDSVVIDETKINIIHRIFFWTAEIQSIPIQHIQDVEVDTSVLFATLKILPTGFSVVSMTENWVKVNYLWRRDALRARRIIAGLLIASREGIDLTKVDTVNFVKKIEGLGEVK
ncbi:MAG TPA: hypothetical protein VLF89_06400 [Candidatus Saccharimonadales bacterium]|nr:hypothetical protein [Candidatus Saccharimonadales bacterium]